MTYQIEVSYTITGKFLEDVTADSFEQAQLSVDEFRDELCLEQAQQNGTVESEITAVTQVEP